MSGEEPATQIAPVESPQMVSTVKLSILKKGEYTLWSMRMEQYLTNTDYSLWQVILKALITRQREKKSKQHFALAIPRRLSTKFNAIKDAKKLYGSDIRVARLEVHVQLFLMKDAKFFFFKSLYLPIEQMYLDYEEQKMTSHTSSIMKVKSLKVLSTNESNQAIILKEIHNKYLRDEQRKNFDSGCSKHMTKEQKTSLLTINDIDEGLLPFGVQVQQVGKKGNLVLARNPPQQNGVLSEKEHDSDEAVRTMATDSLLLLYFG
ncbi:hypothetical protein Tco_0952958 [Tanacetum coccineum]|uniref:Uncharacterized protein n=1 Tax=Tanacetum coccineum TaxID=301880 RepID=A0ABQ5DYY4_9ASTR